MASSSLVAWRESRLYDRIADWQEKPVTNWRGMLVGGVLLANVLILVFWSVASPTWTERGSAFAVAMLVLLGALWFLREGKA